MPAAKIVSILRRARESAQDAIRIDECCEHYGQDGWEQPFTPSGRKPTRAEVFEALRTLPYKEWQLASMLEFDAMLKAGWSGTEIKSFCTARDAELHARGLFVCMWD